jgi:hypothetical protein
VGGPSGNLGAQAVRKLTVRIKRFDPEWDNIPRWEIYRVEADPMDLVLGYNEDHEYFGELANI